MTKVRLTIKEHWDSLLRSRREGRCGNGPHAYVTIAQSSSRTLIPDRFGRIPIALLASMTFAACGVTLSSAARAESTDPLGSVNSFYLPIPSPSFDPTPRKFVIDGQGYRIPRNYVVTTESLPDGNLVNVSMRALLPDLSAISPESAHCFRNLREPCNLLVMTIGIENGGLPDVATRLKAIAKISKPGIRKGPCGFEYYESLGSIEKGNNVFELFFNKFPKDHNVSILRCRKPGSPSAPLCDSDDNLGNGNAFYYVFPRIKICEWGGIKQNVLKLIASFEGANPNE